MLHGDGSFGSSKLRLLSRSSSPVVFCNRSEEANVDSGPCVIIPAMCFLAGFPGDTKDSYELRSWKEFDYVGGVLILAAPVLVVFGLQEAGEGLYDWNSAIVLCTLIIGIVCWLLLFIWEYFIFRKAANAATTA